MWKEFAAACRREPPPSADALVVEFGLGPNELALGQEHVLIAQRERVVKRQATEAWPIPIDDVRLPLGCRA